MSPNTDKVHQLVHQLTKTEKRYFHRYAHAHRQVPPNYWKVYSVLQELPEWDKHVYHHKLANEPFYAHLTVVKTQLYERILDALHLFHRENELDEQIKAQLHQAYLLLGRGLVAASQQRMMKAQKNIQKHQLWQFWPECLEVERLIRERQLREGKASGSFADWAAKYKKGLNQLGLHIPLARLKGELSQLHISKVRPPAQQVEELQGDLETFKVSGNPAQAADFYQSQALLAFMGRNSAQARQANAALLATLEQMPATQRTVPERTLSTLYNYLIDQLQSGNTSAFLEGLSKLRHLPLRKGFRQVWGIEHKIFEWSFQLELNYWVQQKDYQQAARLLPAVEEGLSVHAKQLSAPANASLRHLAALVAFQLGRSETALSFLTPLYQAGKTGLVHEIYHYAHLLYLLCHFEEGNFQLLDHLLTRFQRQIRAKENTYSSSRQCIQFLRRLLQSPSSEHASIWEEWLRALPTVNTPILMYLDLRSWILSKLPASKQ